MSVSLGIVAGLVFFVNSFATRLDRIGTALVTSAIRRQVEHDVTNGTKKRNEIPFTFSALVMPGDLFRFWFQEKRAGTGKSVIKRRFDFRGPNGITRTRTRESHSATSLNWVSLPSPVWVNKEKREPVKKSSGVCV